MKHQICFSLTDNEYEIFESYKASLRETLSNGTIMEPYNTNVGKFLFLLGLNTQIPANETLTISTPLINKIVKSNAK